MTLHNLLLVSQYISSTNTLQIPDWLNAEDLNDKKESHKDESEAAGSDAITPNSEQEANDAGHKPAEAQPVVKQAPDPNSALALTIKAKLHYAQMKPIQIPIPYAPTIMGLEKAKRDIRIMMDRIVKEVSIYREILHCMSCKLNNVTGGRCGS